MIDSMTLEERLKSHKDLKILCGVFSFFSVVPFCISIYIIVCGDLSQTIHFITFVVFALATYGNTKGSMEFYSDIKNDFYKIKNV